jgi:radical SAM-linked protein
MKITVTFVKGGLARYVSHLDWVRFVYRALRRTGLPFAITQGFTPRPKVSFGRALKVGQEGNAAATFEFREPVRVEEVRQRFAAHVMVGVTIQDVTYGTENDSGKHG